MKKQLSYMKGCADNGIIIRCFECPYLSKCPHEKEKV